MIFNKKLKLLCAWENDLFKELSISEIIKLSKKKTKTWVFNSLKQLTKINLLILKRKSNLNLYQLNLNNPILIQILQCLELQEILNFKHLNIIQEIINNLPLKNYCLLIFGSYAQNKQTKDSDIDICFLVEDINSEKKIKSYINEIKMNHSVQMDDHYIYFNDFIEMLLRKEENLGKQIYKNHKIFFNHDMYYQLIKEAYKSGFRQ